MAFSFSNWFKKPSGQEDFSPTATASAEASPTVATVPTTRFPPAPSAPAPGKQTPPRTLKAVVPNSVRPVNLREGMARPGVNPITPPSAVSLRPGPSAVPTSTRPISLPSKVPVAPAAPVAAVAPKAVADAPAFHAAPDAPVTIPLGEFFDRIPTNLLQAGADVDRAREVVFRAADLYSDLARGRASVPVSAVQAACPDLFGRPVSATEDVEITLPLQQVIAQLAGTFHTRPDQVAEDDVAEVETPFLQVALEDSVRLPRPPAAVPPLPPPAAARPASTAVPPPAVVVPAPARIAGHEVSTIRALTPRQSPATPHAPAQAPASLAGNLPAPVTPINPAAKHPPSTVRASVAGGKIRLSGPAISSRSIAPAAANPTAAPHAPSVPPAALKPIAAPAVPGAASAISMVPAQKKTARIQIPPIALRPAGTAGPAPGASGGPPRPGTPASPARAVPFPEPLVSFRATPGDPQGAAPAPAAMPPPLAPSPSGVTRPLPHANITLRPAGGPPPPYLTAPPPMMPFAPAAPSASPAPAAPTEAPTFDAEEDGSTIGFAVAPILRALPEGMFAEGQDGYRAAEQVPDGARVELPLGFITAQLAQGRVAVPRAMFVAAMPEGCRHLMLAEGEPAEVIIPLQEVFQNLPTGALNRRRDQVVDEVGPEIPTPFSQKAQEDAQRLAPAADPEPVEETAAPEPVPEALAVPVEPEPPAVVEPEPEPVTADAPAPPAAEAEKPSEPEPAVEVPALEPVAEVPAVVEEEEEKEPAPEPLTAVAEQLPPVATVGEPEVEAPAPTAPEPEEETPTVVEAAAPAVVAEAVDHPEAPALPAPTEEPPAAPPVELPAVEPAPTPETPVAVAAAATPEVPLPVPDLMPAAPEDRDVDQLPAPVLPAANGQHSRVPMAALTAVPESSPEDIQDALRAIFMVDEELDAKKIVRHAASLPGLKACAVMFDDGLKLAGDLEDGLSVSEGFCAMTPPFFRRARAYAAELGLGETQCVSLQTDRALLSFFMAGNVCLSVQHVANRPFLPGVREKLLAATTEMARMYATPVSTSR